MNTIKPFIDLGWFTVPLGGELKRLSNGKKTIPEFPKNFREKYATEFNRVNAELGGVITGPQSKIVAIDCDNDVTYEIFKTLDPDYDCHFVSKGKTYPDGTAMVAGTIIYEYTEELETSFSVRNDKLNLDFYSTHGFVYLPTYANKTKEMWTEVKTIKPMPPQILALLRSLQLQKLSTSETEVRNKNWVYHLAPQIKQLVTNKQVTKNLFKILTPKDFRNTPEYLANNYLDPKDVVDGRGSEYLSKVSAILGADESIDEELYSQAMLVINGLFSEPMSRKRLMSTIIEPMIEERAAINGEVIWRYNKDWEAHATILVTKLNSSLHVFFDMARRMYYAIDIPGEEIHAFNSDREFFSFLEAICTEMVAKKELKTLLPLVKVISTPKYKFGFYGSNKDTFNTFIPTIPLMVFKDPESYAKSYTYPQATLTFLESLVPDTFMRNYLLRFLKRKLTTFDYSPVILYFIGVSGSGKDTFVQLLSMIIGENSIAKPSAKEFLEKHNGWMLDKYFAHLDEYGDQLSYHSEQEEAKGKIKAWSGKQNISIREMRSDGFSYDHSITFVVTANKNPITFDEDDRRVAYFDTPNNLRFHPLAEEIGVSAFRNRVMSEINDFAYYLATKVEMASADEYVLPPETEDKKRLIASKLNAGQKLAFFLSNNLFKDFSQLLMEYDMMQVLDYAAEGRICEDDLFNLYIEMTDDQGTKRGLTVAMKQFEKIPSTKDGKKTYFYRIPGLKSIQTTALTPIEGDFE